MNRGDRREPIFHDDLDRQRFLDTLAETCAKTDWQVHAWCLMGNHFHLVVETTQSGRGSIDNFFIRGARKVSMRPGLGGQSVRRVGIRAFGAVGLAGPDAKCGFTRVSTLIFK